MKILFLETNTTGTGSKAMIYAKKMGYEIIFWTNDINQYQGMEDKYHPNNISDKIELIDTYNIDDMISKINEKNEKFDAVLAFDDYHLVQAAQLSEHLGIESHDINSILNVRDKSKMRNILKKKKFSLINQPSYIIYNGDSDLNFNNIDFPCVLKPVDDSGSNGVSICKDKKELERSLELNKQRIVNERGYKLSSSYLIEELIKGEEYSAEMLFFNEKWNLISTTKKKTVGLHAIEVGHITNPSILKELNLENNFSKMLEELGLNFGACHIEFFYDGHSITLVEVNPRLAGDNITELVQLSTGIDMIEILLKIHLGMKIKLNEYSETQYGCIYFFVPEHKGLHTDLIGLNRFIKEDTFKRYHLTDLPIKVEKITSSYSRLGYIIFITDNIVTAENKFAEFKSCLKWRVSNA